MKEKVFRCDVSKDYIILHDTSGEKLFKQPRLPEETIPNSITLKVSK